MANHNPIIHENPNIVEAGKNTRFGAPDGPDPSEAGSVSKKDSYSVRAHLKFVASAELNVPEEDGEAFNIALDKEISRLKRTKKGQTSLARLTAVRQFEKAIKKGDTNAASFVTENMEGKLSQELVIPTNKPAPEDAMTLEEASNIFKERIGD